MSNVDDQLRSFVYGECDDLPEDLMEARAIHVPNLDRFSRWKRRFSRVAFVGESHPSGGDPFDGGCGKLLSECASIDLLSLRDATVDFYNLYRNPPKEWVDKRARKKAIPLIEDLVGSESVILCGDRVCEAFGLPSRPYLTDRGDGVFTMPYPTMRDGWWVEFGNTVLAGEFLQGFDFFGPGWDLWDALPNVLAAFHGDEEGWYPFDSDWDAVEWARELWCQAGVDEMMEQHMPMEHPSDPILLADPVPAGFVRFLRDEDGYWAPEPDADLRELVSSAPDGGFPGYCATNVRRMGLDGSRIAPP